MKERECHGPSHNVSIFVDVIYYPAVSVCICLLLLFLRLCLGWVAVDLCSEVCRYLHLVFPFCSSSFVTVFLVLSYVSFIMVIVDLCLLCLV